MEVNLVESETEGRSTSGDSIENEPSPDDNHMESDIDVDDKSVESDMDEIYESWEGIGQSTHHR